MVGFRRTDFGKPDCRNLTTNQPKAYDLRQDELIFIALERSSPNEMSHMQTYQSGYRFTLRLRLQLPEWPNGAALPGRKNASGGRDNLLRALQSAEQCQRCVLPVMRRPIFSDHGRTGAPGKQTSINRGRHLHWYFRLPDLQLDLFVISGR